MTDNSFVIPDASQEKKNNLILDKLKKKLYPKQIQKQKKWKKSLSDSNKHW